MTIGNLRDIYGADALALAEAYKVDVYDTAERYHNPHPISQGEAWSIEGVSPGRCYVLLRDAANAIEFTGDFRDARAACIAAAEHALSRGFGDVELEAPGA